MDVNWEKLYTSRFFRLLRKSCLAASKASSIRSWVDIAPRESLSNEKYSVLPWYMVLESEQKERVDSLLILKYKEQMELCFGGVKNAGGLSKVFSAGCSRSKKAKTRSHAGHVVGPVKLSSRVIYIGIPGTLHSGFSPKRYIISKFILQNEVKCSTIDSLYFWVQDSLNLIIWASRARSNITRNNI
jgi:hypothetical protein